MRATSNVASNSDAAIANPLTVCQSRNRRHCGSLALGADLTVAAAGNVAVAVAGSSRASICDHHRASGSTASTRCVNPDDDEERKLLHYESQSKN